VSAAVAALTAPDSLCTWYDFSAKKYWFCSNLRSWQTARTKCQALGADFDLTDVLSASEDTFVRSHLSGTAWAAGSDTAVEGAWRWVNTTNQFWQGTSTGSAVGGSYTKWALSQPNNTSNQDCLAIESGSSGK
jgi:hypothetical protein